MACVATQPLQVTGYRLGIEPHTLAFIPPGRPALLRTENGAMDFALTIEESYLVVQDGSSAFDVQRVGYRYTLLHRTGQEIIAYHWHPAGVSSVTHPHVHVSGTNRVGSPDQPRSITLGDKHITTGFVSLADIVLLIIVEFGVTPRRPDWRSVLEAAAG